MASCTVLAQKRVTVTPLNRTPAMTDYINPYRVTSYRLATTNRGTHLAERRFRNECGRIIYIFWKLPNNHSSNRLHFMVQPPLFRIGQIYVEADTRARQGRKAPASKPLISKHPSIKLGWHSTCQLLSKTAFPYSVSSTTS